MTNEEKAREYQAFIVRNNPSADAYDFFNAYLSACNWKDNQFKEQKKIDIKNAHKAFVELLAVQYGEDCDESMHQYIDDALKKAMGE